MSLVWKKYKDRWKATDDKKPVGTIQLLNSRYSITFLRGGDWAAVFQTEGTLTEAMLKTNLYYLMHKKETHE